MTDTIFDGTTDTTPQFDETKNYLEDLVGDGKKFADAEALAKGKLAADAFIEQLKAEQKQLREDLAARKRMEDLVDQLASKRENNTPPPSDTTNQQLQNQQETRLTPEQIEQILERKLAEREQGNSQSQNLNIVRSELVKAFGPNFQTTLTAKAEELGVGKEFLDSIAKSQPKVFLKLVGADVAPHREQSYTPPQSSVQMNNSRQPVDRTERFYENLKKTNPNEYWLPKTQNQLHKDAIRLQEAFFDK